MATSSLTKSCFVFKPKSGGSSSAALDSSQYFAGLSDDMGIQSAERRSQTFNSTWQTAEKLCTDFQEEMFNTVFHEMIEYLQGSVDIEEDAGIPTATLITGVNMPDHTGVFRSLAERLRAQVTAHVAVLEAASCTTVQATVRAMVRQLTAAGEPLSPDVPVVDEDDEDDCLLDVPDQTSRQRRAPATMPALVAHYEAAQETVASPKKRSPRKRARTAPQRRPLVVVWRDLEAFQPRVLQDLVLICSQYRSRLPISFVFGVSTCASAVHRLLPQHVSARLSLHKFHSQLATHCLAEMIDKVLLSPSMPFRLGGRALRLLLDIFLYHDFSVNNFISAYKFCMLSHFLWSPASALCCEPGQLEERVEELTGAQVAGLRALPSVRAYLDDLEQEERHTLQHDGVFKEWVLHMAPKLHSKHEELLVGLRCLFALTKRLPGALLGKQFREAYNLALLHALPERDEYKRTFQLLNMLSRQELTATLEHALEAVSGSGSALSTLLRTQLDRVRALDDRPTPVSAEESSQQRRLVADTLKQATSRQSLRESLQSMGAARNARLNPYETLRSALLAELDEHLRGLIVQPSKWPFNECVVFDDVSLVRRRLVGAPRSSVQTALADPAKYLQCTCCQLGDAASIRPTMPDLCIVYKLHLECGRLINLFDWMQAFRAVVGASDDDQTIQARFAHCVAELQFLGFIKSTQRKTDHVARLTWGSC
ncbi:origin recognition complex subunit 3-like [Amphibalanus amphitrite]|uniref:origin recognition complex subunit 3-like n=1 Tax=Amphibalanus amphitrite TaxID=1232801 RepID=UPI001C8FCFF4|nr:origin recognition complex subunit 3-like [Amphibalanus amphitrite]XP_043231580.1 origin recognition complex subunit 3-like [Amphibalanus amphitrite]XP_043231581.1 origin recognition complex subunit 3-like [Amphibalanus amphitrite]XP_043231582.1 origin recognition complex subunit 3-like [Amphibalanus amphitrite]XP_043231583.1 origin recognition complex subunit 3-like [Amphibalanus amphitrite]XP_043231584.1 origin recognition complex subunit 3-like [Amphibalanus amphitrite]